jgi:hypothetical protein
MILATMHEEAKDMWKPKKKNKSKSNSNFKRNVNALKVLLKETKDRHITERLWQDSPQGS